MTLEAINFSVDIALLIYKLFKLYSKSKKEQDLNTFLTQVNIKFRDLTEKEDFVEAIFLHGIPPLLVKYKKEKKFRRKFQKFYDLFNDVQDKYHLESVIEDWDEKFQIIYQKYGLYNSWSFEQLNEHFKKEIEKIREELKSKKELRRKKIKDIIMRSNFNLYMWYHTMPIEGFSTKENYTKYKALLKQNITDELDLELDLDEPLDYFINDLLEENIEEFIPYTHFKNISLISSILNDRIVNKDMLYKGFIDSDFYSILNREYHQEIQFKDTLGIIEEGIKSYKKVFHLRKTSTLENFLSGIRSDIRSILHRR